MNVKMLNMLGTIITDSINGNIEYDIARKKINGILHNKSIDTVISEFNDYISDKSGNQKNKYVLIVVMALLCRNLDHATEIKESIEKYSLTGCLFGGLTVLLSGNLESFSLKVKLNDEVYENKYEFLNHCYSYEYWKYIIVLEAARILCLLDENKFEKLAFSDKSKLILLNMLTYHISIVPSGALIAKLLVCDDELKQNIGFSFIVREVARTANNICEIRHCQENGLPITNNIKTSQKQLNAEVEKCRDFLKLCNTETQASLLFNYILIHQFQSPIVFMYELMSSDLQTEFIKQIKDTGKIRTLEVIFCLVNLISNTPALNNKRTRISKINLYMAVTDLLIKFLEERRIYSWEKQEHIYMQYICEHLPKKCLLRLRSYLLRKRKTLMFEEIDRLVRFKLYLEDKRMADIVDNILTIIQSAL